MVEQEKENANPIAETILSLNLKKNEITIMLEDTWVVTLTRKRTRTTIWGQDRKAKVTISVTVIVARF